ncbi:hypothetical protein ACQ4PT_002766 [Festuca glaucescens]
MGLSSAMHWWEEWQLRILVLGSLFFQFILHFSVTMRRIVPRLRVLVWVAYIGGDSLAIYALATLFSRQKQRTGDAGTSALEVVWAPVLLIHLGGPYGISAYSLEDNELWLRHVMTSMTQITVALYVFCKWWSGQEKLLQTAILLFVVGIIKFLEKPWALRRASYNSIQASSSLSPRRKISFTGVGDIIATFVRCCISDPFYLVVAYERGDQWWELQESESLQKYVEEASNCVLTTEVDHEEGTQVTVDHSDLYGHTDYFADVISPYSVRLSELQLFMKLGSLGRYIKVKMYLELRFSYMYTKMGTAFSPLGQFFHYYMLPSLAIASVVLFAKSHKDGYSGNDIRVTYILLYCTAAQELYIWGTYLLGNLFPTLFQTCQKCLPAYIGKCLLVNPSTLPQYSLLSYCARKRKPTILMKLATFGFLRELINKNWYIGQVQSAGDITCVVHRHVEVGWKEYIRGNTARYKRYNNLRGQLTLRRHHQLERIGWSLDMPFDQSVLLWHVATDLCFHHLIASPQEVVTRWIGWSRDISNYMIYLLFIRPEMLMPGTRPGLFDIASDSIQLFLKDGKASLDKGGDLVHDFICTMKTTKPEDRLILLICNLTEALMEVQENARWNLILGVWLEMLCYSANRCRGYLHAKSLGQGGEYLSTVWLIWSFMGMQTWAERHHNLEQLDEGGGGGGGGGGGEGGAGDRGRDEEECLGASTSRSQGGADQFTEITID